MGLFSGITKSITKPIKKVLKSPLGKAALLAASYRYAPAMWGKELGGSGGWTAGWESFKPWLMGGTETTEGIKGVLHQKTTPNLWNRMGPWGKAATVGIGAAGVGAANLPEKPELPEELTSDEGQQKYLTNRALFEDEWADWLVDMGKAGTKEEALVMVRENPMFSEGGRVKAQGGLFAGQMPGRHPGMNQMRNPNMNQMNQGLGAPNLGPRSMGMTPGGGGGQMDPRMAQMMQGQRRPSRPVPTESADTELIQLIKLLTSLGIPMEQLRGRTKEELVEMLVSVKGKTGGPQGRPEVEEEVVEEEVVQAAHGGRIGMAEGMSPMEAQARGLGAQHHGSVTSGNLHAGNVDEGGGVGNHPQLGVMKAPPPEWKGSPEPKKSWFKKNIYDRTDHDFKARQNFLFNKGLYQGNLGVYWDGDDDNDFEDPRYNDKNWLTSQAGLDHLRDMGYTGGIGNANIGGGGGGAGGQYYSTAGGTGTGTTAGTTDDDYYKFAEWDKWLMPGETATQPMMPGGYKPQILANQGGRIGLRFGGPDWFTVRVQELMNDGMSEDDAASQAHDEGPGGQDTFAQGGITRTGYAMGTEHPIISSKDGKQLDMRDTGGYQPHGKAEKHDDVRALLAQGEFVMTSDAVKGMGGGDREVGAKKMYNLMHNMEAMA